MSNGNHRIYINAVVMTGVRVLPRRDMGLAMVGFAQVSPLVI